MNKPIENFSLVLASAGLALGAVPAAAADFGILGDRAAASQHDTWERHRSKRSHRGRDYDRRYANQYAYGEPVYRDTRVWRGNDGRYHCQKKDGTTGLIIGGAVGALLGREIDTRGDRTLGTILGAAGGALLGKEVAQGGSSCR